MLLFRSLSLVLALGLLTGPASAAPLRAGASAIDITPTAFPRIIAGGFLEGQASKVTDRLHTRTLVLDDGKTPIAIVIVDTCMMTRALIDEAKRLASQETGIPTSQMLIAATHTHSAPAAMGCLGTRQDQAYAGFLVPKIVEGLVNAWQCRQPAKLGVGVIDAADFTHTRRWIRRPDRRLVDPFGQLSVRANMHPGHESLDVTGPSGPSDPDLTVISVQTAGGKPLALFANFSMHYFGAKAVSADYYGAFAQHIARQLGQSSSEGPDFVAAMSQGTSGDQQWMDYSRPRPALSMDQYAEAVAQKAMEAYRGIQHRAEVPLAMTEKRLTLNYRVPDEKRLAWARPIAAQIVHDLPKDKTEVYAREALILHERQKTEIKLQALRVGDLAITALPNEVYAITGLKLKGQSPLPLTMNIELANGAEGYIPPPEQHLLGGYTTWPARTAGLEVQAEPKMVETLLAALEEISGQPRRAMPDADGAYVKAVTEAKPRHHWRLNEIVPDDRDEPGIARYLEGVPGPAFSGKWVNRAPHFAGGRLRGPTMSGSDYSVECWFWNALPTDAREVTGYVLSRGPDGGQGSPGDHLAISGLGGGAQQGCLMVVPNTNLAAARYGRTKVAFKQWHHVVMTRSGKQVRVFLDGKAEIEAELDAISPAQGPWFIGGHGDGKDGFEGKIDEVAFYDRALTAEEVAKHYQLSGMTPPPLATATLPLPAEASAKRWHVREGYRVELAASEPVVMDPVAFDWDAQNRLWVVEMADYPLGMDGQGKAGGRVVRLEDRDADGRYDHRQEIVTDLSFPTGILTWRDGVIVTAAPDIWFIQADGKKQRLFTGFSTGNQQLRVNGLRWGMDGWVYCAAGAHHGGYNQGTQIESLLTGAKVTLGSRDFRFHPDTAELEPQSGPAQFGRARDDWGHWFGVQNSFPLWHYVLEDHDLRRNPHVIPPDPIHQLFPRNPPVFPVSPQEKRFHSFDQAGRFTSACGIEVYRDALLWTGPGTHAFTCEPFHNLVQHHVLVDDGVTFEAKRDAAEATTDFLASEDRWCRPVMVRTGPDGALWVADMYRYMIEHPQWLPENGKQELLPHYREGDDRGRIWRVVKQGAAVKPSPIQASIRASNGWLRDQAQMQMLWGQADLPALHQALTETLPQVRAQAAWTLHLINKLSLQALHRLLRDEEDAVVVQALKIAATRDWKSVEEPILALRQSPRMAHARVRLQLALSAGHWEGEQAAEILAAVLSDAEPGSVMMGAAMSSALPHLKDLSASFGKRREPVVCGVIGALFRCALATRHEQALEALVADLSHEAKLEEILQALEIENRSLHDLASMLPSPNAQARIQQAQEQLQQAMRALEQAPGSVSPTKLRLLAHDLQHRDAVTALLPGLWQQSPSPEALELIARLKPEKGPDFLLADWRQQTPLRRRQIIETLLRSDAWTLALLRHVQKGHVSVQDCDAATQARLLKHPQPSVNQLARRVLTSSAKTSRAEVVSRFLPALKLSGEEAKGKVVFAQLCQSCHRLDGEGIELGPDLRSVSQHEAEKLLNSILDPSAIIEPGFMAYHATLKNGEQLYGVIATETSASLTFRMPGNLLRSVLRSEVRTLKSTGTSLMPEGLEAALSPQSLADLIAYLKRAR